MPKFNGGELRRRRISENLTQTTLADMIGVCASSICRFESGRRNTTPSSYNVEKLARVLGCCVEDFYTGTNEKGTIMPEKPRIRLTNDRYFQVRMKILSLKQELEETHPTYEGIANRLSDELGFLVSVASVEEIRKKLFENGELNWTSRATKERKLSVDIAAMKEEILAELHKEMQEIREDLEGKIIQMLQHHLAPSWMNDAVRLTAEDSVLSQEL